MKIFGEIRHRDACRIAAAGLLGVAAAGLPAPTHGAGDLSRADPDRGDGRSRQARPARFVPRQIKLETGKLYKLILRNPSNDPHYFTSDAFSGMVFTRKVQVTQQREGKTVTLAEFKGAIREIEVYPGHAAEWWFVPVAAGRVTDLRCGIVGKDGKTHARSAWSARS